MCNSATLPPRIQAQVALLHRAQEGIPSLLPLLPLHPGTRLTLAYLSPNLCLLPCHCGEATRTASSHTRPWVAGLPTLQGRGQPRGPQASALLPSTQHSTGVRGHLAHLQNHHPFPRRASSSHRSSSSLSLIATPRKNCLLIPHLSLLALKRIGLLPPLFPREFPFVHG